MGVFFWVLEPVEGVNCVERIQKGNKINENETGQNAYGWPLGLGLV